MELVRLNKRLEGLGDASTKGYPIRNLYGLMYVPTMWYEAYANIYTNDGAMTRGVDEDTLDGMSHKRINKIINSLKEGTYRCKPVRRVYIPKPTGKLRPLGIPSGTDKVVQQVCKTILERIYEPVFSNLSHGFRPNRSCHTALEQVRQVWTGTKWFIEFDILGFFDHLNHDIMVKLLESKIDDKRFIKLIKAMLKAGYLEDWRYHQTYSGTPQGGIISPILSNIYLHELDCYVEKLIKEFSRGKRRPPNPKHQQLTNLKHRVRKKMRQTGKTPELAKQLTEADTYQKRIPSGDPCSDDFKRLRYCRYADDFILGVIGSKDEAICIQQKVTEFLNRELNLQIAEEKTAIASGKKGIQFLSYSISTWRANKTRRMKVKGTHTTRRTVTESITLRVPLKRVVKFNQRYGYACWEANKPLHRSQLLNGSDEEIILTYNAELSGLANFYSLAYDVKSKLNKLVYLAHYSLLKTLASKHKCKKTAILKRLKVGQEYIHYHTLKGKPKEIKVFRLKHIESRNRSWVNLDEIPNPLYLTASKSELIRRMEADVCEYCGVETSDGKVHHVRKLKDLKSKPKLEFWEKVMIYRNRKTLILCGECHSQLHAGQLADNRYKPKKI